MSYQLAARDVDRVSADGVEQDEGFSAIIGRSPALRQAAELGRRVARRGSANVLLEGETGTGKEIFARALHYAGPRPQAPFVAVNCAAIPGSLLESELFGYERGAFTDARQTKLGLLELAAEGTLFLDEVASLPLDLQPKLLRAIEERRVRRVGGFQETEVRCRVVAATNEPLEGLVAEGLFRDDLFYRLNVLRIQIPPLRDRPGDVALLADHFLREIAEVQGLPPCTLSASARIALEAHDWPGNVRELKNVLERAAVMSDGREIGTSDLFFDHRRTSTADEAAVDDPAWSGVIHVPPAGRTLRSVEAELLRLTLSITDGNKAAAARILGISRPTLHKKIGDYGIVVGAHT